MGMTRAVRFGPWTLEVDARRLARDGVEVHVTPKAFDLLVLLVREAPRVVPKDELHRHLWPESHVADVTLAGVVKELRRAIDGDGQPSLVRTVHRVGYAFTGVIEPVAVASSRSDVHWLVLGGQRFAPARISSAGIPRRPYGWTTPVFASARAHPRP